MISRILVIIVLSAGLAVLPMLALAGDGGGARTATGGLPNIMPTMNEGTGTTTSPGTTVPGSMDESRFNARLYHSAADCLNAATAAHVALSACNSLHNR